VSYLEEPPESAERAELYAATERELGYVANYARVFAHRPNVYRVWDELSEAVRANMSFERYEVATIAAARERGSRYCALAHGRGLAKELDSDTVVTIATGTDDDAVRRAVYDLARQVAAAPSRVRAADLEPLRELGLSDADILDVVLTAAIRCFFSTVLSATGVEPDPALYEQDPAMVEALTR
jgi:uncharacterized peroxidase-related enzyme